MSRPLNIQAFLKTGIVLVLYPFDTDQNIEIQRAPDDGGGNPDVPNVVIIALVNPGVLVLTDILPIDAETRHYRIRHRVGNAISGWSEWTSASPMEIPDPLPAIPSLIPQMSVVQSQSGSTGTVTLTVQDPARMVTGLTFAEKTGAGGYGGFGSAWDTSTGTEGTDVELLRTEDISLAGKHNVAIQIKMAYLENGLIKEEARPISFDEDFIAQIGSLEVTVADDGDVIISATGDEDTANMYFNVGVDGAPGNPTSGAHDATIPGRNGSVDSGINLLISETGYIKAIAYNSTPTAGPVTAVMKFRRGVGTQTVKTVFFSFLTLMRVEESFTDWTADATGVYMRPVDDTDARAVGAVILPKGVTLTEVNMRWYRASQDDTQRFELGLGIFSLAVQTRGIGAGTVGWEVTVDALNQLLETGHINVFIRGDADTDGDDVRFDYVMLEYTATDVDKTL